MERTASMFNVQGGKNMWTLNLITAWSSFGCSNLQMCPVIVDQTCTTVRRDCAPYGSAVYFWHLVRIALLGSCQSISFGLRSALWHGHSRRRIFLLLNLIYSSALGHCPVASLSLSSASNGRQTNLHSPAKRLDYLSNLFVLYVFVLHIVFSFPVTRPQNILPVALRNIQVFYCQLVTASCTNRCSFYYLM